MKNVYIIILPYMLFAHYVHAMENRLQLCLYDKKPHVKTMEHVTIADCPVSAFFILPKEIRDKIIRLMCNISDTVPVKLSIEDGIQCYSHTNQHCPLNIGNKIYSAEDLLTLNSQQRKELVVLGDPSFFKRRLGFSRLLISKADVQALDTMPENIRKDLKVEVFDANGILDLMAQRFCGINMQVCMLMSYVGALGNPVLLQGACLCEIGLWTFYGCMGSIPACHHCVGKNYKYEKQY